ncbi:formyl transferase [Chloroflexota bacterium]
MKTVFMTFASPRAVAMLFQLKVIGISPDAIIIEKPYLKKRIRTALKRLTLFQIVKIIWIRLMVYAGNKSYNWLKDDFYYSFSDEIYSITDFNGSQCENLLKRLKPDLILLGYSPILKDNIIKIPAKGILNAHPGLLPKYRGTNIEGWAILNGDPLGVTVHFVDRGIDTGPILSQRVVELKAGDTYKKIEKRMNLVSGELMAETVLKIINGEELIAVPQQLTEGKLYHRMPADLRRQAFAKLKSNETGTNPPA